MESLFETKLLSHKNDPETSSDAAKKMVESGQLTKQQSSILNMIKKYSEDHPDFTPIELADGNWSALYFAIQRRKNELARKGLIIKTGKTRNGCEVWRLK